MSNSRQLFTRLTVYVVVFVLVTVSYINFTNKNDDTLEEKPPVPIVDANVNAVEDPEAIFDDMDEEMVLGEVDYEDLDK
jgi:hypothetical protein